MSAPASRARLSDTIALVVGAVFLLWFPLVATFGALGIPLAAASPLLLLAATACLGATLALVAASALPLRDERRLRSWVFACAVAGIVLAAVDISLGGATVLNALTPDVGGSWLRRPLRLFALLTLAGAISAIIRMLGRHAVPLLAVVGISSFVSTLIANPAFFRAPRFTSVERTPGPPRDLPPVIYIVLDEAMGLAGLDAAPAGADFSRRVRSVFERHGFRIYPNAFSRHFSTVRSIPNAINFDVHDNSWGPVLRHHVDEKVQSRLFDDLVDQGYDVVSYGTEHIDFCFSRATRCEILPSFNPLSSLISNGALQSRSILDIVRRARMASYIVYGYAAFAERMRHDEMQPESSAVDAYAFPAWFDRFARDVEASPRGRAYFAHILSPHSPHVVDRNCQLTGQSPVPYFLYEKDGLTDGALDARRAADYRLYYEQYGCVLDKLDNLLARIQQTPRFDDATIVVHGDHGARISSGQYYEHLSERDYLDNYSALFAIKGPGIDAVSDGRPTSIQRLVAEYLSHESPEALGSDVPTIAVDSVVNGKVILRDITTIGSAPTSTDTATAQVRTEIGK